MSSDPRGDDGLAGSRRLNDVEHRETLGDRVPLERVRSEVADGWSVRLELVQYGEAALEEALVFERSDAGRAIHLKPVRMADPTGDIEWYERRHDAGSREHVRTVGGLENAVRAAVNRTRQSSS